MKALIEYDNDTGSLKLRLLSEGSNDRTLLLLLEKQYPMVHRSSRVGITDPRAAPESLEVPVASPEILEYPAAPSLSMLLDSSCEVGTGGSVLVRTAPWRYAPLKGAKLRITQPAEWIITSLVINGRAVTDVTERSQYDIYPETIVELTVRNCSDHPAVLTAFLEDPDTVFGIRLNTQHVT
jgi:hypothetical protein